MDLPMPSPLQAGWELVQMIALLRALNGGQALGGFSAAAISTVLSVPTR